MKNKKGFTLVELLAVIVILGIIAIIAIPSVMNAVNQAKNKISEIEKKHLIDGAEEMIMEVISCDMTATDFNYLFNKSISNCSEMQDLVIEKEISTTVTKLKGKGYFEDPSNKCNGEVRITTNSNYKVAVNTNRVVCIN